MTSIMDVLHSSLVAESILVLTLPYRNGDTVKTLPYVFQQQ